MWHDLCQSVRKPSGITASRILQIICEWCGSDSGESMYICCYCCCRSWVLRARNLLRRRVQVINLITLLMNLWMMSSKMSISSLPPLFCYWILVCFILLDASLSHLNVWVVFFCLLFAPLNFRKEFAVFCYVMFLAQSALCICDNF